MKLSAMSTVSDHVTALNMSISYGSAVSYTLFCRSELRCRLSLRDSRSCRIFPQWYHLSYYRAVFGIRILAFRSCDIHTISLRATIRPFSARWFTDDSPNRRLGVYAVGRRRYVGVFRMHEHDVQKILHRREQVVSGNNAKHRTSRLSSKFQLINI